MPGLIASRHLYNEMLEAVKTEYEASGQFLKRYDLNIRFKGRGGESMPQTTVQMLSDRLHKAVKRFVHRKEFGAKVGFPRFKSANQWHSIQLRQFTKGKDAWIEDDGKHLHLPAKLGKSIKVKMHRPLEGTPKTAHLRSKRGSHRRKKAAKSVAKTHLKIARQRKDFLHKVSHQYALSYSKIVLEDLNISGMVKSHHLAKSISDASWRMFVDLLTYKAENAGHQVVTVPAHFTSQRCFSCGELVPKTLSVRTHRCPQCGYVEAQDVNAAKNILRDGTQPSVGNADDCVMRSPRSRPL
ncbi:MAG: transposase [Armatimonadetes bacterium]|nr:transposase [Armatimonadota bacterium]